MCWRFWVKKKRILTNNNLNAKHVWGKIIIYLREHHLSALHVACGDIKDVEIKENNLIAYADQEYIYSIISKQENQFEINNALNYFGFKLNFVVKLLDKPSLEVESDILTLKDYFDDYLKIK